MDETKIDLKKKVTSVIISSIFFSVVYNFMTWYTSSLTYVPSFVFSFEKYTPFLPWTVIPYLSSGIFFIAVFFCCKTEEQLSVLSKRILFIITVAGICYFLYPLKFSLIKSATSDTFFKWFFQFIEITDSPYNEAPSLHIAFAFIFWSVFRVYKTKWRTVLAIWFVLLGVSTLTTYQHHLFDVVTGAILAQVSFVIFPAQKNNFQFRNFHIANYYFLFGWIIILVALLLFEFCSSFWLLLFWPSLVLFIVGYHYQKNTTRFLKNVSGSIIWYKKTFYFPYLAVYWLFWKFLRKNKKPIEILPKIYISSRLDKEEILNFKVNQNTLVYDFSAELEEDNKIKNIAQYFSVPMLDVGAFDALEIKRIVLEISKNYKHLPHNGKILVHCTMGFTRSTFVGILLIKNILSLPTTQAIAKIKHTHKNAILHSYLHDFLKTFNI
ncbi:phosphatase PAP2 family protein [Cellulophaga baltica]|uniref:phosphatase PAP2 family protein n=1 Tax=Cellulophaga TaxID=104264 RepID=UPI001C06F8A4|nr:MULTISPECIES: phosphatase PAP2 family protein [Cellulophaga]MBU2996814.1 phosphatase PAP2 family protein [Cellulophaga baltica]MDO6768210.1 phosphatase PAP2 family protein [Cellulophaga sp. 1_MG-2023]